METTRPTIVQVCETLLKKLEITRLMQSPLTLISKYMTTMEKGAYFIWGVFAGSVFSLIGAGIIATILIK